MNDAFHEHIERYFSNWTKELAWIYGLILGDGHISCDKRGRFVIGICGNHQTVSLYRDILKIPKRIETFLNYSTLCFYDQNIGKWFVERGILGKKSHKLPWPEDIPENLMHHFMRGLIDSDGCWVKDCPYKSNRRGKEKVSFKFSSNTEMFCKKFQNYIGNLGRVYKNIKKENGKEYVNYVLWIRDFNNTVNFGALIYKDSENLRNEDRYKQFQHGLTLYEKYQKGCVECGQKLFDKTLCAKCFWKKREKIKPICSLCEYQSLTYRLCSMHYNRFLRRRRVDNLITPESFINNASMHKALRKRNRLTSL